MNRKASATGAGIVLAAAVAAALAAAPAAAEVPPPPPGTPAASGTVAGTVTTAPAAAPCILLESTTTDFGTRPFQANSSGIDGHVGTPGTAITNCSGTTEKLFARVSNATGGSAVWTPFNTPGGNGTCPARGIDRFIYRVGLSIPTDVPLGSADAAVPGFDAIPDGGRGTLIHTLHMPCVGSGGAGQQMSMTSTFTASL